MLHVRRGDRAIDVIGWILVGMDDFGEPIGLVFHDNPIASVVLDRRVVHVESLGRNQVNSVFAAI